MTARLLKLLVVGIVLSGCAQTTSGTARSEPDPPPFPDQSGYVAIPADTFFRPLRGGPSYQFVTPNHIHCRVTLGGTFCSGKLPGLPGADGCTSVEGDLGTNSHTGAYTFTPNSECPPSGEEPPVLGEGQQTTLYMMQPATVTCGVGPENLLACRDTDGHGFVVQPGGSWVF